jgi:ABC-type multidrug transport system permease subunit
MAFWVLAKKELRVLARDRLAAGLLLGLPLLFILVLGLMLGEGFGQKPDDRLRVSIVDLDEGPCDLPGHKTWSEAARQDLEEIRDAQGRPGVRIEIISDLEEAKRLVAEHKRAAVLVFKPGFSRRVNACSFLKDGINPFHHDGVYLDRIEAELLPDGKQPAAASLIDQVAQVSLLRVLLPWMIGRAFEKLSEPDFIQLLGDEVNLPVPGAAQFVMGKEIRLGKLLSMAAGSDKDTARLYREKVGAGVQAALAKQFGKYDLTGKTWAKLTRDVQPPRQGDLQEYENRDGSGFLKRGAQRYQVLVPAYTVMFSFFLVLNVGWVFVAERRQGTLRRLQAAPLTRSHILLGKLAPYYLLSLFQGLFLLTAGRLLFGMRWGPAHWTLAEQLAWLLPVLASTALAATGLAMFVAALARTEMQVALFGAVPALVLALLGGCVLPPEMMPESGEWVRWLTPQGWALSAYREFLDVNPGAEPNLSAVPRACAVLVAFGAGFLGLAWAVLRLD